MDKKGEGRLTALYSFLGILFVVGVFLPFVISSFVDTSVVNPDSYVSWFADLLNEGANIHIPFLSSLLGDIKLDIFFWLPDAGKLMLSNYINVFSYIPNWLALPIMVFMFMNLIYVVITLIPTVGG